MRDVAHFLIDSDVKRFDAKQPIRNLMLWVLHVGVIDHFGRILWPVRHRPQNNDPMNANFLQERQCLTEVLYSADIISPIIRHDHDVRLQ